MSCIYLYIVCYIPRVQHPVFWWFSMIFHFENPYMLINDRISMVMRFHRGVLESMCPWFQRPLEITISQSFRKEGIPKWAMTKTLVVLGVHGGWQASQLYGDYIYIYCASSKSSPPICPICREISINYGKGGAHLPIFFSTYFLVYPVGSTPPIESESSSLLLRFQRWNPTQQ